MLKLRKYRDKILGNYNSYKSYFIAKWFIIGLVSLISIIGVIKIVDLILNNFDIEDILYVFKSVLFTIFFGLVLNGILQLIYSSSGKIEDNMKILPKDIGGKKTIVQFGLLKKISPSEAAMILYGRAELSNLICIIYKWVNSGIVNIYTDGKNKYLEVVGDLGKNEPFFERILFNYLFPGNIKNIVFNRRLLLKYKKGVEGYDSGVLGR